MADLTLDASGLLCPLPILKAQQALGRLSPGSLLEVIATDPGSVADFEAFCRTTGHALVASREEGETFRFLIRSAPKRAAPDGARSA